MKNFRKYLLRFFVFFFDHLLRLLPKKKFSSKSIQKILFSIPAHIGDVVMATSVLPVIKRKYPFSQIGFIVGSWAKSIVEEHPFIDFVHVIDHSYLNRRKIFFFQKLFKYLKQRKQIVKEIKSYKYDAAVDLYFYFPSSHLLFYQANIPLRVGYVRYGGASLLTHPFKWYYEKKPLPHYYKKLLTPLGIEENEFNFLESSLPHKDVQCQMQQELPCEYVLFHMGCGNKMRKWPLDKWKQLRNLFEKEGYHIVFTGVNEEEKKEAREVIHLSSSCSNLCNRLSIKEWITTISLAKIVISVESGAGHIAAAVKTPCLFIHSGTTCEEMWKPFSKNTISLRANVPCAPCFKKDGCRKMSCIYEIDPKEILEKAKMLIAKS